MDLLHLSKRALSAPFSPLREEKKKKKSCFHLCKKHKNKSRIPHLSINLDLNSILFPKVSGHISFSGPICSFVSYSIWSHTCTILDQTITVFVWSTAPIPTACFFTSLKPSLTSLLSPSRIPSFIYVAMIVSQFCLPT